MQLFERFWPTGTDASPLRRDGGSSNETAAADGSASPSPDDLCLSLASLAAAAAAPATAPVRPPALELHLIETKQRVRLVRATPRAEGTHLNAPFGTRTPRKVRNSTSDDATSPSPSPPKVAKVATASGSRASTPRVNPPLSSRVALDSSTFARAAATGALAVKAVPNEETEGLAVLVPTLRERERNIAVEAWDEPVRLHTESLSTALGIDWAKYQRTQDNTPVSSAQSSARGSGRAASARIGAASPSGSRAGASPLSQRGGAPSAGGRSGSPINRRSGGGGGDRPQDGGAGDAKKRGLNSGRKGGATEVERKQPAQPEKRLPASSCATSAPTVPVSARKLPGGAIYTRDGRRVDVSMISDQEAELIERVQGHSSVATPTASHHSVSALTFGFDGTVSITPRAPSGVTPRSNLATPRSSSTPRAGGSLTSTPRGGGTSMTSLGTTSGTHFGVKRAAATPSGTAAGAMLGAGASTAAAGAVACAPYATTAGSAPPMAPLPSALGAGSCHPPPQARQHDTTASTKQMPATEGSQWGSAAHRRMHINYAALGAMSHAAHVDFAPAAASGAGGGGGSVSSAAPSPSASPSGVRRPSPSASPSGMRSGHRARRPPPAAP